MNTPKIAHMHFDKPIYKITDNSQSYYHGLNCAVLGYNVDDCKSIIIDHHSYTQEQLDMFWEGYHFAKDERNKLKLIVAMGGA